MEDTQEPRQNKPIQGDNYLKRVWKAKILIKKVKKDFRSVNTLVEDLLEEALQLLDVDLIAEIARDIKGIQKIIASQPQPLLPTSFSSLTSFSPTAPPTVSAPEERVVWIRLNKKDLTTGQVVEKIKSCGSTWASVVAAKPTKTRVQVVVTSKEAKQRAEANI